MRIKESNTPGNCTAESYLANIDYKDSYGISLTRAKLDIRDIYLEIFTFSPWGIKKLFIIRNKIVGVFGLNGPSSDELHNIERKSEYKVGEKIGLFILYSQGSNEIIAGADDKHLDFRVSVQRINQGNSNKVIVTTVVKFNNTFGRAYLFLIKPLHKFLMKKLLVDAIENKRL